MKSFSQKAEALTYTAFIFADVAIDHKLAILCASQCIRLVVPIYVLVRHALEQNSIPSHLFTDLSILPLLPSLVERIPLGISSAFSEQNTKFLISEANTMAGQTGIYLYEPSRAGAIIAASAFGISATYHLFQMIRKRAWFYGSLTVGSFSKILNVLLFNIH